MESRLRTATAHRLARFATEALSPAVLVSLMMAILALTTDPAWRITTPVAVVFFALIPQGSASLMAARGTVTDKFIVRREQRYAFYGIAVGSTIIGAAATLLITESHWVTTAAWIAIGIAVATAAINLVFKISLHALIAALSAIVIASSISWWQLILTVPAWLIVSWSRVALDKHSSAEVLSGSALGLAAAGVFLWVAGVPMA